MTLPEDFTDRLMERIEQKEEKPRRHRAWLYTAIGAIAASILLLLAFHFTRPDRDTEKGTIIATQTQQPKQPESPYREESGQNLSSEQQSNPVRTHESEFEPVIAQDRSGAEQAQAVGQQPQVASAVHKTPANISTTDSLDYYIDKIERELAQVDESLYIERMNKVIHADERLQRLVNSYILHTLDKEGRPQAADNMYNVNTEQDEE
ncbi:MAG: hypothetical protein IJK08_05020 [Prevotella sp.]|nr:hypothetical protein [Prevotella sp.]